MRSNRALGVFFVLAGVLAACGGGNGGTSGGGAGGGQHAGGDSCDESACGPRPQMPNSPCADGVTVAGPACARDANGRCAWIVRECPPGEPTGGGGGAAGGGAMCGGIAGVQCPTGQFCNFGSHCGAGDQSGTCQAQPEVCAEIYQPVCGCDGRTYGNECDANRAGVSVASQGECTAAGGGGAAGGERACGSRGMAPCGADEFCDWAASAQCGATDVPGVCRPRPQMCTREFAPVCGCDGQTHPTRCVANSQGVSVAHDGPC
ncbi:Kazal-type serine protease inhibitor family protein [Sandaracinus amylolyticus]|uniref:Kazal-type serine protease inhibitor family protein n=1 Tax=Sandaracinus amylolyticus TaxID=927083 RepID=UPI0009463065|nr:Kazal-type serine protease inhibitor domain-containing protein [Sandaracinus amylolyticus]